MGLDEETLAEREQEPIAASASWLEAPPIQISPRLRATGSLQKRGLRPKVQERSQERSLLAQQLAAETEQTRAARTKLANGQAVRLSELGELDRDSFALFLQLLGDALSATKQRDAAVAVTTGDGSLRIELEPLALDSRAQITTPDGAFQGRDYRLLITDLEQAEIAEEISS